MNWLRLAPLVAAFSLGLSARGADGAGTDALETIQKTAVEWTRLRSETNRLQTEWERERALLGSTRLALEERIATLTEQRDTAESRAAEVRAEIDALKVRHRVVVASIASIETRVSALVSALIQIRPSLPPRLSSALELPYRSLADDKLPTGERVQHATTILSRCLQFNKTITFSEEVLGESKGPDARVAEVVYWGLAEAFAIDRLSRKAFVGQPAATGWAWTPRDEAFAAIARLIDVHKDTVEPEFAEVPARLVEIPSPEVRP